MRKNIKENLDLRISKKYMDHGKLVPDQVTIDMLNDEINNYKDSKVLYLMVFLEL